jgi:transcriptional regulator with XRE-family HTH domain
MNATGTRIGKLINESGLNDKQLGKIMHLSVQSINKWRHGYNLPDTENLFVLSRILGKRVDDFLVPLKPIRPTIEVETGKDQEFGSTAQLVKEYAIRLNINKCATLECKQ